MIQYVQPITYMGMGKYTPVRFTVKRFNAPITEEEKVNTIIAAVSKKYNVSASDMCSKKRHSEIVTPRQVAIYLILKNTGLTLKQIGSFFGDRDHSTVIYSREAVRDYMFSDKQYRLKIETVERELANIHYQSPVFALTA